MMECIHLEKQIGIQYLTNFSLYTQSGHLCINISYCSFYKVVRISIPRCEKTLHMSLRDNLGALFSGFSDHSTSLDEHVA